MAAQTVAWHAEVGRHRFVFSETHPEPMTVDVESLARAGGDPVSPELALVDPALAEIERSRLPAKSHLPRSWQLEVWPNESFGTASEAPSALRHRNLVASWRKSHSPSWALLVVGTVAVMTLLLLDLRVEAGGSQASAERLTKTIPRATRATPTNAASRKVPASPHPTVRRLAWAPAEGASGYHIELFRRSRRVFSANSSEPAVTMPATWRYDGARHVLEPGDYRWYVWPIVAGTRGTKAIVQTTLTISGS